MKGKEEGIVFKGLWAVFFDYDVCRLPFYFPSRFVFMLGRWKTWKR